VIRLNIRATDCGACVNPHGQTCDLHSSQIVQGGDIESGRRVENGLVVQNRTGKCNVGLCRSASRRQGLLPFTPVLELREEILQ
jgi:hypothetical protein